MSTGVHRFLVTTDADAKFRVWSLTAPFANWIEGRDNGDRETWLVTCFAEQGDQFTAAARATGVTVEEIEGAGDSEHYRLLVGEPGSGWEGRA
jgi:hypothetical protein